MPPVGGSTPHEAPACYRITTGGVRALKQLRAEQAA